MQLPLGYPNPHNHVYRLYKSLYGLKQASRQWFAKLNQELVKKGYQQSKNDYSLFIKKEGTHMTFLAIYVDDILLTGNDPNEIHDLKSYLHSVFSIKDLGRLHYFLGIEVAYANKNIILHQNKFTKELLLDSGFDTFKKDVTPLPSNLKLSAHECVLLDNPTP